MAEAEELEQIIRWLTDEGLAPESSRETQLCFLWGSFLQGQSCLDRATSDLETSRLQHFAEMAEVRKSLEQIRIFTEQKDVLAQEIQNENEELRKQLEQFVSLQDAQMNEVAKMLYQQGLTELIPSSASEQVAYLLIERASLLETNQDPAERTGVGEQESHPRTLAEPQNPSLTSSTHKRSPRHSQSSWKKMFGLHKTFQSKHTFVASREACVAGQPRGLEKRCSRLEQDVEEGSRRLAMAHKEIRRLKDELESAHCFQKEYEPELQSAQEEVEKLKKEVEKLKRYEMVELRKAKEYNDRLDLEIRALRNRVRCLDPEKNCRKKTTELTKDDKYDVFLQEQFNSTAEHKMENKEGSVESLQKVVEQLEWAVGNLHGPCRAQTGRANELTKFRKGDTIQVAESQNLSFDTNMFCQKQSGKQSIELLENYHCNTNNLIIVEDTFSQLGFLSRTKEVQTQTGEEHLLHKECPDRLDASTALLCDQAERDTLKGQLCEALNCIDEERSKYHNMKERFMEKLCRAKQKLDDETVWRENRMKSQERELSLCHHSLKKEKEVVVFVTAENESLLSERRRLLQQLSEEEENLKKIQLTACLSKNRVEYLEAENKNMGNKVVQMSNQISLLEGRLQNMQLLHFAEELQKMSTHPQKFTPLSVLTTRLMSSDIQVVLDTKQADQTSSPACSASAALTLTAELGYLNLTSKQSVSDNSRPESALPTAENHTTS